MNSLPIIDYSGYLHGGSEDRARVIREIHDACTEIGFFYLTGHGIPQELIDDIFAASAEFFAIPAGEKEDVRLTESFRGHKPLEMSAGFDGERKPGGAELFTVGTDVPEGDPLHGQLGYAANPWPKAMPSLQPRVMKYFDAVSEVCSKLMSALAEGLDIDPAFFEHKYQKPTSSCVLLHYPPLPGEAPPGMERSVEHTDWGSLTMLYQDNCGGLEVKNVDGEWIEAPPLEGAYVVNIADMLQRWSNDRFVSTPHRAINRSGKDRYSIGVFYNPQSDAIVDPRELGVSAAMCRHEPITAGKYIAERWADFYGTAA